ncbi:UDP-N-acetylmuramoyl-L-alanyl-D-glutamate--2,6-diaminopimelate ligase, partial [bacterium]
THILRHIISETGESAGVIGTLGYAFEDGELQKMAITTPGAEQLWRLLAKMRKRKIKTVAIEASSHGLHQKRTWGLHFDAAIFTNLTQDHLDYHGDMKSYIDAKCILFNELPESSLALVNIDDPCSNKIISENNGRLLTYSIKNPNADIIAEPLTMDIHGSSFSIRSPWGTFDMQTSLPGRFNIYNVTAAVSVAFEYGYDTNAIIEAISRFKGLKGRFQKIELGQSFAVIVDYAHTPDALRNLILATRELSNGKIIIVFGAGGDRDNSKRQIMGKIAAQYADIVIVTSDNPRSENPMEIIRMIEKGISENKRHLTIPDRREAIFEAIRIAHDNDIVLIAGKGHEDYQIFKDKTIHFDDVEVAKEAIGNSL